MSYIKQEFTSGAVLLASQLNHIEDGIVDLETEVNELKEAPPDVSGQINSHNTDTEAHRDIRNAIPTVPTNVSAFTNDAGYQTAAQVQAYAQPKGNYLDETDKQEIMQEVSTAPAYIRTASEAVAEKVISITGENAESNVVPFTLAFLTDLHNDDTSRYEAGRKALEVISETAPIDLVVMGGDYLNNYNTASGSISGAREDLNFVRKTFANLPMPTVWLRGNHDSNGYPNNRLSKAEVYNRISRANHTLNGFVENSADPYGCYGYIDYDNAKIRVITVNTSDNDSFGIATPAEASHTAPLINCHNISGIQLKWIADVALDFSDKEDAFEWGVIFISHLQIYHGTNSWYNSASYTDDSGKTSAVNLVNLANLAKAYRDKTAFSVTHNGVTVSKDFSSLTEQARILCFINGHGHSEQVYEYQGFNFITCPSMNNSDHESADGNTYNKTALGTAGETAVTVLTVDRANNTVYAWIYGSGYDRIIDIEGSGIPQYTITRNLSGCTSSSAVSVIAEGNSHSETITAKDGYTLDSATVKVTMGGVDISSSYSNGKLTISNVTGNIVIEITAVEVVSGYTNIIDTVGYKNNIRLSTSDGASERDAQGYTTTGRIDVSGCADGTKVRTKGVNFNQATYTNAYMHTYNADGSFANAYGITSKTQNNVLFELDSNGNLTLTFDMVNCADFMKRFRLVGYGDGANLIVTVNEEITD